MIAFPHAIKQLTKAEFGNLLARAEKTGAIAVYLRINGAPHVVGASAERHGITVQRTGAARYARDYYGLLAAAALTRLYDRGREVMVFGSHSPGDMKFHPIECGKPF